MTLSLSGVKEEALTEDRRIAIVGMSCLFPQSPDLVSFWQNIVQGKDCIREVGPGEWNTDIFYEPFAEWRKDERFERIYCKTGGFITESAEFNALKYGVMPNAVAAADPDQMLALRLACQAIADAGYDQRSFDADKAEVIIGRTSAPGHGSMNAVQYGVTVEQIIRVVEEVRPDWDETAIKALAQELRRSLKTCSPESIPGVMPNILAGRIAGKLGFRGKSLVLDAACASSLIAVEMAVHDLRAGLSDLALAGGSFVNSFAVFYQLFSRLGALSHSDRIRPFDQTADGTLLGEGIGMVVLKRMSDAIRDGDRIYASILGVGSSSDGRGTSMLAPAVDGEALAIQRAYDDAGVSPRTISLIEAHGTATAVGDVAEMQALAKVFGRDAREANDRQWCAIGSVKSMIGHCQAAAGIAGLIKTALALYQRVLPPTLNVEKPNNQIDWQNSPCYINTKARPWIHARPHPLLKASDPTVEDSLPPRRAGVSAFGFGGVNAHVVLEEIEEPEEAERASLQHDWESEVFCFADRDVTALAQRLEGIQGFLQFHSGEKLKDLAFTVNCAVVSADSPDGSTVSKAPVRLALVCQSVDDLKNKLALAKQILLSGESSDGSRPTPEVRGIYVSDKKTDIANGKVAFLLPGLGAAYPGMLAELCLHFPEVRMIFDFVDDLAAKSGNGGSPSEKIFPPPDLTGKGVSQTSASLAAMDAAVVTVLMAEWAIFTLLLKLEIVPDILVGCSTGEFAALTMSGAADILTASPVFYHLSTSTARSIPQDRLADLRSLRVAAPYTVVEPYLKKYSRSVYLGADLSDHQLLLSGFKASIEEMAREFDCDGIQADLLPSAIPYHTPLVEGVIEADRQELLDLEMNAAQIPSWSCSTASFYPSEPEALKRITTELFSMPILFRQSIEALYQEGVRKFVEVGPKGTLTSIVSEILSGKPHLAVASNRASFSAVSQLNHMVAALFTNGVAMNLEFLFKRRDPQRIDLAKAAETKQRSGSQVLKLNYPEVRLMDGWQERTGLTSTFSAAARYAGDGGEIHGDGYEDDIAYEEEHLGEQEQVVRSYLGTMASFHKQLMSVQEEVMASYLVSQPQEEKISSAREETEALGFPLLRGASVQSFEDVVRLEISLDLENHRYLLDHAIGGAVRSTSVRKERVFLVPLTVALELMAEAASYFYPGLNVSEITDVRAYKRIRVGAEGVRIAVLGEAINRSDKTVRVEIRRVDSAASGNANGSMSEDLDVLMSCQIKFANEYAIPAALPKASSGIQRAPRLVPSALYGPQAMFHGPRMQSVLSLDSIGERDIVGRVSSRKPDDWYGGAVGESSGYLVHPLLLDNATQLVLFHLYEHDERADALLPFIIDSIRFYEDLDRVSGTLTVKAVLNSITQRNTNADVFILDETGRLLVEFKAISSRRILLDESWHAFVSCPDSVLLGGEQHPPANQELAEQPLAIREAKDTLLPDDEGLLAWCADYVLTPAETQNFESFSGSGKRREWLLGRIAAKEAVRDLVAKTSGANLCLADIEIYLGENGRPLVADMKIGDRTVSVCVSITHKNGTAMAMAMEAQVANGVGIDLEAIETKETGFEELLLNEAELSKFKEVIAKERDLFLTKAWSVKEAVGKAIGSGLFKNPKTLEIVGADTGLSEFEVVPVAAKLVASERGRGEALKNRPESSESIRASCRRVNDFVLAIAICR